MFQLKLKKPERYLSKAYCDPGLTQETVLSSIRARCPSCRIYSPTFPLLCATLVWAKLGKGYESWKTWLAAPFYLLQSGHPADMAWQGHREEKKRFPCLNTGWKETASSNCSLLTVALFFRRVFPCSPPPTPPTDTKDIFIFFRPTCSNLMNHTWGWHDCHSCPAAHSPARRIITWKPQKRTNRFLLHLSVC